MDQITIQKQLQAPVCKIFCVLLYWMEDYAKSEIARLRMLSDFTKWFEINFSDFTENNLTLFYWNNIPPALIFYLEPDMCGSTTK